MPSFSSFAESPASAAAGRRRADGRFMGGDCYCSGSRTEPESKSASPSATESAVFGFTDLAFSLFFRAAFALTEFAFTFCLGFSVFCLGADLGFTAFGLGADFAFFSRFSS